MKFKRGNIHNIIFCLLALLPLVLMLINFFSLSFNYEYLNSSQYGYDDTLFSVVRNWSSIFGEVINYSNFLGLHSLFDFLNEFGLFQNELFLYAFLYFGYLVILETFDLIYLAVYGFIRLIRSWIHKMGGDL